MIKEIKLGKLYYSGSGAIVVITAIGAGDMVDYTYVKNPNRASQAPKSLILAWFKEME